MKKTHAAILPKSHPARMAIDTKKFGNKLDFF